MGDGQREKARLACSMLLTKRRPSTMDTASEFRRLGETLSVIPGRMLEKARPAETCGAG